jgi:hypothetical protein
MTVATSLNGAWHKWRPATLRTLVDAAPAPRATTTCDGIESVGAKSPERLERARRRAQSGFSSPVATDFAQR